MSAYCYPSFKTKRALKKAVASGQPVKCRENTPWGPQSITNGAASVEGPNFQPHKWYARVWVQDGLVAKVS